MNEFFYSSVQCISQTNKETNNTEKTKKVSLLLLVHVSKESYVKNEKCDTDCEGIVLFVSFDISAANCECPGLFVGGKFNIQRDSRSHNDSNNPLKTIRRQN